MDHPSPDIPPTPIWSYLQAHPQASIHAILRVTELTPQVEEAVQQAGCRIRHRLHLLPALAVEAPAQALLGLREAPWLVSVELDQMLQAH